MNNEVNILTLLEQFIPLLIVMLGTFIVGYVTAYFLISKQYKTKISKLKNEVNAALTTAQAKDIETIFTEIKPKILDIVKENQKQHTNPLTTPIPQKTKTTYVTYVKHKPSLNFDSIGKGNSNAPDDLTKIDGIGPYLEERLNEIGIYNFHQISNLKISDVRLISDLIELFPTRIESEKWIEQATSLAILEKT